MKLLIDLPIEGERCGACPLADGVCICPLFDEVIFNPNRPMYNEKPMRCAACIEAELALSGCVQARVQEIVRLAFERSKEGTE